MSSEGHSDEAAKAAPTVSVVGDAAIRTQPDEAFLSITLTAVHESPGPALYANPEVMEDIRGVAADRYPERRYERPVCSLTSP